MGGMAPGRLATIVMAWGIGLGGCAMGGPGADGPAGSARVALEIAPGVNVDEVQYVISRPGTEPRSGTFPVVDGVDPPVSGIVAGLPEGTDYTITLTAETAQVRCEGSETFDVVADQTTEVHVVLQCRLVGMDGGVPMDAGPPVDAGPPPDAGMPTDAGRPSDGGPTADAGVCDDPPTECRACTCQRCPDAVSACYGAREQAPACAAVIACRERTGCTDLGCYCGDAFGWKCLHPGWADGPCKAEIEAAAGTTDPWHILWKSLDRRTALGKATALLLCERCKCGDACGAPGWYHDGWHRDGWH